VNCVLRALRERRSVRQFERRSVPVDVLLGLVEAGCWAPSGGNRQAWRFIIVTDERRLRELRMVSPGFIGDPPAAIVVCESVADLVDQSAGPDVRALTIADAFMAAYAITLAAHGHGLGSCIIGSFNDAAVRHLLRLPAGIVPALIVTVGYPARIPDPPQRRTEGVWYWETYGADEADHG